MLPAGVAVLGVERLKAGAAVRSSLLHDVALASQHGLALEAAEVLHVPVATLGLSALVCKDDLREEDKNEWHSSQVDGDKGSARPALHRSQREQFSLPWLSALRSPHLSPRLMCVGTWVRSRWCFAF